VSGLSAFRKAGCETLAPAAHSPDNSGTAGEQLEPGHSEENAQGCINSPASAAVQGNNALGGESHSKGDVPNDRQDCCSDDDDERGAISSPL